MDVSQMRMMLALAECKSMTATAKKLHVTQPALTYQLNVIEKEVGFKVFNRTRTGTSLTPEGEFLLGAIGSFVADYEKALHLARSMSSERGNRLVGTAVIGTVKGDAHDIGKNLVRIELESRDIEVADLGSQVPAKEFVRHVRENEGCRVVLVSVSRTDLLRNARAVVSGLERAGLRDRVFVMVGGAAASAQVASDMGADYFTTSADDAAEKAREVLERLQ